jgi:hypothetical protein
MKTQYVGNSDILPKREKTMIVNITTSCKLSRKSTHSRRGGNNVLGLIPENSEGFSVGGGEGDS